MKISERTTYYFIGNIPSHALHATPLYEKLGGTFVVLSKKAEKELINQNLPVIRLQNSPRLHLEIGSKAQKTMDFLEENASVVLFYELFSFDEESRLKNPKTIFMTHGNMLKNYMGEQDRVQKLLDSYSYMAALGPVMKKKFISLGIPEDRLLDIGVARTDEVVNATLKRSSTLDRLRKLGWKKGQKIVAYPPTYWGDSSVYETGLDLLKNIDDDMFLIVRPHPQTKNSLLRKYKKFCSKKPNALYAIEGEVDHVGLVELFAVADVIVGDVSSVMLEAILLDKPLIFAYGHGRHRQNSSGYEDIKDIVEFSQSLDESNSKNPNEVIKTAIQNGVDNKLWNSAKKRMFYNYNGTSAESIIKTLDTLV